MPERVQLKRTKRNFGRTGLWIVIGVAAFIAAGLYANKLENDLSAPGSPVAFGNHRLVTDADLANATLCARGIIAEEIKQGLHIEATDLASMEFRCSISKKQH